MPDVAAAVLAAGAGTRMGRPKADVQVDGVRLLDRALDTLIAAGCRPVYAVVRAATAPARQPGVRTVVNPDPARGMRSSLELAVDAVEGAGGAAAIAVVLVDTPGVTAAAVRAVTAAWRPGRVAVADYAGRTGHPTVMSPRLWRDALAVAGPDEGARALLRARPELLDLVAVGGDPTDLDTPADLAAWRERRDRGAAHGTAAN